MIPVKPILGSRPWAIVLCKFSDQPQEPQPKQFFIDFVTRGNHGINDYFHDTSYGNMNIDGSQVFGWLDLPYTLAQDKARVGGRYARITAAIEAVKNSIDFRPFYGICIMLNATVDSGGIQGPALLDLNGTTKRYGLVVLDNLAWGNTWAAQEMAHGFSLDHSWSADPDTVYGNPFDVMSAFTNNFGFPDQRFGTDGPGFNAPNLDLMGWLPDSRVFTFQRSVSHHGAGIPYSSTQTVTISLTALNHPENNAYLDAKIAATTLKAGSFVYNIEHRVSDGWDAGLGVNAGIVITQVRADDNNYLVAPIFTRNHLDPGERFIDTENNITVLFVSKSNNVATVEITAPVHHVFNAFAGPAVLDWHIYESIIDTLHAVEKERIHQVETVFTKFLAAFNENNRTQR